MTNFKLGKKSQIIIAVSVVLILIVFAFFMIKSLNNNDEVSSTPDAVDNTTASSPAATGNTDISQSGSGGSQNLSVTPKKITYTDAQILAVLISYLGPIPQDYTASVNGTEVKNGTNFYKVTITSKKNPKQSLLYYVEPASVRAFMSDPKDNSLIPVVKAVN